MRAAVIDIAVVALAALFLQASPARALDEVRVGVLAQGFGGWSPDKEQGVSVNLEALFQSPEFLRAIGSPRPLIGASIATDSDATSRIYAGLEWKAYLARKFFVAGTFGAAVHNGEADAFDPAVDLPRVNDTQFLGCRALFHLGADVGYDLTDRIGASVHWQHMSNAGLCADNEGLDNLGLRFGYRF